MGLGSMMPQLININYATGVPAQLLNDPNVPGIIPAQIDADPGAAGVIQVAPLSDPGLNPTKYILAAGVAVSSGGQPITTEAGVHIQTESGVDITT
jgi:hypothetical protein